MNNILKTKIEQNYIDFPVEEMNEFVRIFNKIEFLFPKLKYYLIRKSRNNTYGNIFY